MLETGPRVHIQPHRFPPVPVPIAQRPRRLRASERRALMAALAAIDEGLPLDWPDLSGVIEALNAAEAAGQALPSIDEPAA